MRMMPIIFVTDVQKAIEFFDELGFKILTRSRAGDRAELEHGESLLSIQHTAKSRHTETPPIELCFVATQPLERVRNRLEKIGMPVSDLITNESYGHSISLQGPDGLPIRIVEHQHAART